MKKYNLILTDNTAILDIEDEDPIFLNETATLIIDNYINGKDQEWIYKYILESYSIVDEQKSEVKKQIFNTIREFNESVNKEHDL
ncbi:hypothetical protein B5C00_01715 [Staphylococcus delphini]|uniref:Uncharacterized protein n=1 Tax=Staphylococcus lutrae TaxID=155085 RepID=A0AAC9WJI5_9STAP|nr:MULTISPECIES: hypothetical protein [Staphylococcus]ARJ51359.1 hypothetical protein B5P37_08565 [Staphylococcus lutrae]PCF35727.1 hypothetical protein B5C00_01715 [Staphylococcus delphini]